MIWLWLTIVDIPKKRADACALQMLMLHKQFQTQEAASIVLPAELIIQESGLSGPGNN